MFGTALMRPSHFMKRYACFSASGVKWKQGFHNIPVPVAFFARQKYEMERARKKKRGTSPRQFHSGP